MLPSEESVFSMVDDVDEIQEGMKKRSSRNYGACTCSRRCPSKQEMSNRWVKRVTRNLTPSRLETVTDVGGMRQEASSELAGVGLIT